MRAVVPTMFCESDDMCRCVEWKEFLKLEALALLWRRLRLGSASGVVCAAAHDHVGGSRLPGNHYCKGCEGLEAGSQHIMSKGVPHGGMPVAQGLTHL
jgi:hypothetical protein